METAPTPTANAGPRIETITLETPIARGDTTIATLQIRKPTAGELRGLQLQSLMQGDVNAIIALIPRITLPPLIQHEAEQLELADLAAICGTVTGFFMSKAELGMLMRVMGAVETDPSTA